MTSLNDQTRTLAFALLSLSALAGSYIMIALSSELSGSVMVLPISYLVLGMLIKYGDQAYDERTFSRRNAFRLAVPGGLLLGFIMIIDNGTATIALGLLISLLLAGKYDNKGFMIAFLVAFAVIVAGLLAGTSSPSFFGIVLAGAASFADEWGDGWAENRNGLLEKALCQRPFLKVMVLLLCVVGLLSSYLYFLMFLTFDFGYSLVEAYSEQYKEADCASI